jgi:acetolactate synthase-1/3 small subunit
MNNFNHFYDSVEIRRVISVIVINEDSVLSRIIGLFSARGYNIESLTVAPVPQSDYSRMTIVTIGSKRVIDQIVKQLNKLIPVLKVNEHSDVIEKDTVLIKIPIDQDLSDVATLAATYKGSIQNVTEDAIVVSATDELAIPSFLQDIGKLIISDIAKTYGKSESFLKLVKSNQVDIEEIEKKMVGLSSSEITANMFKHWKLSETLINSIEFIDNIQECKDEYLEKTRILKIAKTACTINNPLDDKYIQKALDLAKEYGFDIEKLSKALDILQERLLDEKKD